MCYDGEHVQEIVHDVVNPPLSATVQEIAQRDDNVSSPVATSTSGSKEKILKQIANNQEENSSSDSDYLPGDDESSDIDEEAAENKAKYKDFKKKYMLGEYLAFADGDNISMTKKDMEVFPLDNMSHESDTSYFSSRKKTAMMKVVVMESLLEGSLSSQGLIKRH